MAEVTGSGSAATVATEGAGAGVRGVHDAGSVIALYLPVFAASGTGDVTPAIHGNGSASMPPMEGSGAGVRGVFGSGVIVLPTFVGAGSDSGSIIVGDGAATIAPITANGSGRRGVVPKGSPVHLVLPAAGGLGSGIRGVSGTGSAVIVAMEGIGEGLIVAPGSGAAFLPAFVAAGSGSVSQPGVSGSGAADIAAMIASGIGRRTIVGSGVLVLPPMNGSGGGRRGANGVGAAFLPPFTASGKSPGLVIVGAGNASLPALSAGGTASASPWHGQPAPPWFELGGAFASLNTLRTLVAGIGELIAAQPSGVALARFAWADMASGTARNRRVSPSDVLGFVPSVGLNPWAIYQSIGRWWVRAGTPLAMFSSGDFWARFESGAARGDRVYARIMDGSPISGYGAGTEPTPWYVVTEAPPGGLAIISTTSRVQ